MINYAYEWKKEMKKFVPSITSGEIPRNLSERDIGDLLEHDVIIITYQTLLKAQDIIGKIKFKLIISCA